MSDQMHYGLQKMTLLDYPGRVACTVFTTGCNFRCPFCHNAMLVDSAALENDLYGAADILSFLKKRQGILEGVCITGGEPLLHEEVFDLMRGIKALGYLLKLDSNGSFPDRLRYAVEQKLADYVAMDIKNSPEKYGETAGLPGFAKLDAIRESVEYLKSGTIPFEFRTTVVDPFHTAADFEAIGQWLKGAPRYFLQKFVDSGELLGDRSAMRAADDDTMRSYLDIVRKYVPQAELRGV